MQILLYSTRTNWLLLLLTLLATPLHLFKLAIVITVLDVSRFCPPRSHQQHHRRVSLIIYPQMMKSFFIPVYTIAVFMGKCCFCSAV